MVIAGNEAMALGALAAGLKFAAIYPMTPISSILTSLAAWEKETDIVLRQPEDEIAGINMAIGASFAGVRSLVATSGGGFALMNEALSLAGITETPVVVIFGQRSGPATGLPTCTGQEDLLYALNAAHGEYPRILLAPGDAQECFYLTAQAFNLADIYQTPVVILVDKLVCEAHQTVVPFNFEEVKIDRGKIVVVPTTVKAETEIFPRYQLTADGISPRIFPGQGKIVKGNSDEHNEFGFSDETGENRVRQMEKRQQKLAQLDKALPSPALYGPEEADLTLVGWGSVKGPILEAMSNFNLPAGGQRPNKKVNFLHLNWLRPFPAQAVKESLSKAKRLLLVENNYQGQLGDWIRLQTGIEIKEKFLKYNGHQFYPEEIADKIKETF
jgi:2-oxoglutarate ferredoxin oxidoreductase subunit alpha